MRRKFLLLALAALGLHQAHAQTPAVRSMLIDFGTNDGTNVYRSGMNEGEVLAMAADSLLKASLELYAPLDGSRAVATDSLTNLAQSTNTLSRLATPLAARASAQAAAISLYPNPSAGLVQLQASRSLEGTVVQVFDLLGRAVRTATVRQNSLDMSALPAGVYSLQFQLAGETVRKRLVRQAE